MGAQQTMLALLFIVNKAEWLGSPANIKGANKGAKIQVGRSMTVQHLLFCAHTLCTNYVTNTFLLVRPSVRSKQLLCFLHGQGQKSEQKPTTKNFVRFHNHSPLLTMMQLRLHLWVVFSGDSYLDQHRFQLLEPVVVICKTIGYLLVRRKIPTSDESLTHPQYSSIHIECLEHGHIQEQSINLKATRSSLLDFVRVI